MNKNLTKRRLLVREMNPIAFLRRRISLFLFKYLMRNSLGLFLKGNDIISVGPQLYGSHEPVLTNFIDKIATDGHSDFLVDIGANIGLTSCQNGASFEKVISFEPNPLCVNILKTNLQITLDEDKFELHDYALGDEDGMLDLFIPKHNWGGAFVKNNNEYSNEVLSSKDGFSKLNEKNYLVRTVTVKNSIDTLSQLLNSLVTGGKYSGVIKIDVEGYEGKIIRAIGETLPKELDVYIIFENWDPEIRIRDIKDAFGKRNVELYKFERSVMKNNKLNFLGALKFLLLGEKTELVVLETDNHVGDIIVRVN